MRVEETTIRISESIVNDQIIVSPNPTSNYINLENKTSFDKLEVKVADSFGRVYSVSEWLEGQLIIDCTDYNSGVYFVTITHPSGFYQVKKIVVNK